MKKKRSWVAEMMAQITRPARFKDKKKEAARKACRVFKSKGR